LSGGVAGVVSFTFCKSFLEENTGKIPVFLGSLPDLSQGTVINFPEFGLIFVNEKGRFSFLSTKCTHLGCTLRLSGRRLMCPCHGGIFDLEGDVLDGPPEKPLTRFEGGLTKEGILYFYPDRKLPVWNRGSGSRK